MSRSDTTAAPYVMPTIDVLELLDTTRAEDAPPPRLRVKPDGVLTWIGPRNTNVVPAANLSRTAARTRSPRTAPPPIDLNKGSG